MYVQVLIVLYVHFIIDNDISEVLYPSTCSYSNIVPYYSIVSSPPSTVRMIRQESGCTDQAMWLHTQNSMCQDVSGRSGRVRVCHFN